MKRKLITGVLALALMLTALTGCGSKSDSKKSESKEKTKDVSIASVSVDKANGSAKIIQSSACAWLMKTSISQSIPAEKLKEMVIICNEKGVYTDESGKKIDFNVSIDDYLDTNFHGCFAFVINDGGENVSYAVWSNEPIKEAKQLSKSDDGHIGSDKQTIGCYPLK